MGPGGYNGSLGCVMMLKGHFNGEHIILDEPAPENLLPDTPVKVIVRTQDRGIVREIAAMAESAGLPTDSFEQYDHDTKGGPVEDRAG